MVILNYVRRLWKAGLSFSGAKWLVFGGITGLACGVLSFIFTYLVQVGSVLLMEDFVGYEAGEPEPGRVREVASVEHFNPLNLLVILVAAAFISALIHKYLLGNKSRLHGTKLPVDAFHKSRGEMPVRIWLTRVVTSILTLISGGSAGREGPIAMLGAGCASWFGKRWKLSRRDKRILLVAGMAGGIAAVFRAPLAGTLFAAEILYSETDLEAEAIIPGFVAAITAFCCYGLIDSFVYAGSGGSLTVPLFLIYGDDSFGVGDLGQLFSYTLVAVGVCVATWFMRWVYFSTDALFQKMPISEIAKPVIGALGTGLVAVGLFYGVAAFVAAPELAHMPLAVLGAGYSIIQDAFDAFDTMKPSVELEIEFILILCAVAVGKIFTSALTIGTGNSGGLFGPSMVIGGCVGAAIGFGFRILDLDFLTPPMSACVVMGMASSLTSNFRTPLAALLMVSELTGGYQLLLPAMWVCSLSFILSGRRSLIYTQVPTQLHSSAHRGHFFSDVLAGIRVEQVFDPDKKVHTLHPDSSMDACKKLVTDTHQNIYPVVDNNNSLTGIFSMNDLRSFLYDDALALVAVAQDIATDHIIVIHPKDSLATTMRRFTELNIEEIPVVSADEHETFLGMLSRREVITHYNEVVEELRAMRKAEGYDEVTGDHATSRNP